MKAAEKEEKPCVLGELPLSCDAGNFTRYLRQKITPSPNVGKDFSLLYPTNLLFFFFFFLFLLNFLFFLGYVIGSGIFQYFPTTREKEREGIIAEYSYDLPLLLFSSSFVNIIVLRIPCSGRMMLSRGFLEKYWLSCLRLLELDYDYREIFGFLNLLDFKHGDYLQITLLNSGI